MKRPLGLWDVLVIADMGRRTIVDGQSPGSVPPEYAGGVGEEGLDALRDFVRGGGTLVCFNGASGFAIDLLDLDVENGLAELSRDDFFCGGSLLQAQGSALAVILAAATILIVVTVDHLNGLADVGARRGQPLPARR